MQRSKAGSQRSQPALGDGNVVAPFFRIPGLMRGDTIERYLASRSLMTWSVDFAADDWLRISAGGMRGARLAAD